MINEVSTENDLYTINFLEDTFLSEWKNPGNNVNFRSLELQLNSVCNADCLYCYYTNYGDKLYPKEISNSENILKNLNATITWLIDNEYKPALEIFTGEIFAQKLGRDALELIYSKYKNVHPGLRPPSIMIPSNYTFFMSEKIEKFANDIIEKFGDLGIEIILSASFDGKLLDEHNRPLKSVINSKTPKSDPRDDKYYDKVFSFAKRHGFGFHPMIYSNKIELWRDNFLWFQDMMKKHDINWESIYLLEVRNAEWSTKQIQEFGKFLKFLIKYSWEKLDKDNKKFKKFIFRGRAFNILSSPFNRIGRGIGCSVQSSMYLRLGDMSVNACHRTMYPGFEFFKFKMMDDKIIGIKSVNPELMTTIFSTDYSNQPYCEQCSINKICPKGCLGAQYEVTGDFFTPIPTVCELEHMKIFAMIEGFQETGLKPWIYSSKEIKTQWEYMERIKNENNIKIGG